MPEPVRFETIVREQRAAVASALDREAAHRGYSLPRALRDRASQEVVGDRGDDAARRQLRDLFGDEPPLALIAFDTPGVHDYVFGVRHPVDIAGGSHFVAAVTERDRAARVGMRSVPEVLEEHGEPAGACVFAGGGNGLVIAPRHHAEALVAAISSLGAERTKGDVRTVPALLPVWPEDLSAAPSGPLEGNRYQAAVSALLGRVARERSRSERLGHPLDPRGRRCSACRRREGTVQHRDEWICAPCSERREIGGRLKRGAGEPRTFEDLTKDDPRLAVLYADGANFGGAFQELDSIARHRALSVAVEDAFDRAVGAVRKMTGVGAAEDDLLFQAPIRGGDDAILILPVGAGIAAAQGFAHTVEEALDRQRVPLLRDAFAGASDRLTAHLDSLGVGVGLVFADSHFPVGFLVRHAEELLRSAKGHLRLEANAARTDRRTRSAIDFLVLASGNPLSESIAGLRERHSRVKPRGREPGLLLTERPYTLSGFDQLVGEADALTLVPPSQRFAIRQEILRGHAVSLSLWRYQNARAKEGPNARSGWAAFRNRRGVGLDQIDTLLWRDAPPLRAGERWKSTRYFDALDLLSVTRRVEADGES